MQHSSFPGRKRATGTAHACVLIAAVIAAATAPAQQLIHATGPLPSFEVATVKLANSNLGPSAASISAGAATAGLGAAGPSPSPSTPGGEKVIRTTTVHYSFDEGPMSERVHMTWNTKILIEIAFGLPIGSESRVIGGPQWIDSDADRYEINAKIDDADFATMQKDPHQHLESLMEQSLLADRFHLKVHFETRELPVYTLVVAKGGPRLTPAKPGEVARLTGTGDGQNNILTAQAMTIGQFVRSPLLRPEGRMVLDRTGLTGAYDFTLKSSIAADPDSTGPSLFTAMEEQLGLKLLPTKAPTEVIVIDHIDRPGAN
ncbi:MAG TPA: TIGR03435 family protein [Acidobacteriaceae bacterium]|nr:TIGR03435 family protein [Acidobacteriaceae bacterium]